MRLLIVTFDPPSNVGGIEGRAVHYTEELVSRGVFVTVIALAPDYRGTTEELQGAVLHKLPSAPTQLGWTLPYAIKLISRDSIDSVFLLSGSLTIFGISLLFHCRNLGISSAAFFYGKDLLSSRGRPTSLLVPFVGLFARKIAVNSRFTASLLPFWMGRGACTLYPAVDPSLAEKPYLDRTDGRKTVLFVGRLVDRKGLDTLMSAFSMLLTRLPTCRLEIVGDGPARQKLGSMIHSSAMNESIETAGSLRGEALYARYAHADVLVLPSRTTKTDAEGFGTVFLEAGVFAKPVIGTRSGGIPEAVVDGKTGFLVGEDNPDELCERIFELLSNQKLALEMGRAGRERVLERFSWKRATSDLVECLNG